MLPRILFEIFFYILALEMARPVNQHCACIGVLSFPKVTIYNEHEYEVICCLSFAVVGVPPHVAHSKYQRVLKATLQ